MAFKKVLILALVSSVARAAPSPQFLSTFGRLNTVPLATQHVVAHQPLVQSVRTVAAAPASVSQHHTSISHNNPSHQVVRTINAAQPLVHTVAQPSFLRTVATQPLVHAVSQPAVVRTVAQPAVVHEEVINTHPRYNFGYSVSDAATGDSKSRQESRDGDVVTGSYSVADPDGRVRHVEYSADAINGFQAEVTYDGEPGPVAIPLDAPTRSATTHVSHVVEPAAVQVVRSNTNLVHAAPTVVSNNAAHVLHTAPATQFATSPLAVRTLGSAQLVNNGAFLRSGAFLNNGVALRNLNNQAILNNGGVLSNLNNHAILNNGGVLRNLNNHAILNNGGVLRNLNNHAILNNGAFVRTIPATTSTVVHA